MGDIYRSVTIKTLPNGRKKRYVSKVWYGKVRDAETGEWCQVQLGPMKDKAREMLAELMVDSRRGYLLPHTIQNDGLRTLSDWASEYRKQLAAKNDSASHIVDTIRQVELIIGELELTTLRRVDPDRVLTWLAGRREIRNDKGRPARRKGGFGVVTSNKYLQAFKSFCRWVARKEKIANPMDGVTRLNPEVDLQHVRRTLSPAEFDRFLATTAAGKTYLGLTGTERARLYTLAAMTGLRAKELQSLTPQHFDLQHGIVEVEAASSKRKRLDRIFLQESLVRSLRDWLPKLSADKPLWPGRWRENNQAVKFIRFDLKAAGIPYRDGRGRVFDFHALRSQFGTDLAREGVALALAQKLLRHSTPLLTAKFYSRFGDEDLRNAMEKLPASRAAFIREQPKKKRRK